MLTSVLLQSLDQLNSSSLSLVIDVLTTRLIEFGEKLIIAALVFVLGLWLISWLRKLGKKILSQKQVEGEVSTFINSLINMLLKVVLFVAVIGILGIPIASLAAIIAAGGLAIGLAMKDNLSNFAGGVMILLNKPFKLKDRILVQGMDGIVTEIGILYTILLTFDGRTIYIPNGPLSTGNIVNYSTQKNRRVDIALTLNSGNDATSLKSILMDIINKRNDILVDPEPFVGITNINNSTFEITVRVWTPNDNFGVVYIGLNEAIYNTLAEKGIIVPSFIGVKMMNPPK